MIEFVDNLYSALKWAQVNWTFSLALLCLIGYGMITHTNHKNQQVFSGLCFSFLFFWLAWRFISNNVLDQWGYSALNAWTLGESEYGFIIDIPNIDLTILGWIGFFLLICALRTDEKPEEEPKKQKVKNKETKQKTSTEEALERNEKKVDDLFDDI